uniref:outer membrane beta-barrel protein n=3 Tax=Flavobacterium sp. TaxID=239 RepID=UPI00404B723C
MKELKKIDRLFQEKFKDFEADPPEHIWENIADKLGQKKKKRIIPIWFQYGSVASIAILLGWVVLTQLNENNVQPINETEDVVIEQAIENSKENVPNSIENQNGSELELNNKDADYLEKSAVKKVIENQNRLVKSAENKGNETNLKSSKTNILQNNSSPAIVNNSSELEQKNESSQKAHPVLENGNFNQIQEQKTIANNVIVSEKLNQQKTQVSNKINNQNSIQKEDFGTVEKKIIEDKIGQSEVVIVEEEPNELDALLQEKEAEKENENELTETKFNKWQVASNVAPVYFNSLAEGSSIDNEFSNNSKTYETNLSVGLGLQYALNENLSIRAGVNRFTLGYNTNDISIGASLNGRALDHVNHSAAGATISVKAKNGPTMTINDGFNNENSGFLNQRIGYFEVPFEVSYKVLKRKFGITVIGGMSSLFLVENQISVVSTDFSTPIGEANNLNPLSFSTNIGIGIDYPFWKSFHAHFEPILKYQINTFNSEVGNFKPYFIGLYSGISYRF